MPDFLKALGRDWLSAPIAGTAIAFALVVAGYYMIDGNLDRGMLWLILANLWMLHRGPMPDGDA